MSDNSTVNINVNNIKKTTDNFSFISTICSLIVNESFKSGCVNTVLNKTETQDTNIWTTLSAIASVVDQQFYEHILHYIDNISNIELCKVASLESIIKLLGLNFSVFNTIKTFPLDI
jgi:hypothetical protein